MAGWVVGWVAVWVWVLMECSLGSRYRLVGVIGDVGGGGVYDVWLEEAVWVWLGVRFGVRGECLCTIYQIKI